MDQSTPKFQDDYSNKMKGLIFFRALFAFLLLGSTLVYGFQKISVASVPSFLILIGLCTGILLLSVVYFIIYRYAGHSSWFAYVQLTTDSFVITVIVFVTGSFISFFTFLYLIVIICSSMLLFKKGSRLMISKKSKEKCLFFVLLRKINQRRRSTINPLKRAIIRYE